MEMFIPSLLLFIVAIIIVFFIVPKSTPMITAILAILFIVYGIYDHRRLFITEYQLSTWQEKLKVYSPAIMIILIILFIIYSIIAFFTSGSVPIPSMPAIALPNVGSITNSIAETVNNASKSIENMKNNSIFNNSYNKSNGKNSRNGKNISKSFLETV